jgi:hypothetical protein
MENHRQLAVTHCERLGLGVVQLGQPVFALPKGRGEERQIRHLAFEHLQILHRYS